MKKIDIKGKDYVPVNERIIYFRTQEEFKGWSYITEIVKDDDKLIRMCTTVYDDKGTPRSNGYAQEKEGSTYINKTSYVENCETSSVGRALGNLGIGIDTSVASFEEVANAINNQNGNRKQKPPVGTPYESKENLQGANITLRQKDKITNAVKGGMLDLVKLLAYYKVKSVDELSFAQANEIVMKKLGDK